MLGTFAIFAIPAAMPGPYARPASAPNSRPCQGGGILGACRQMASPVVKLLHCTRSQNGL
uniref:Uncharacterized protein n=1 Tax=mine drainage metagenome TaxID=410659 RepID=E6PT09_9ZZZZ